MRKASECKPETCVRCGTVKSMGIASPTGVCMDCIRSWDAEYEKAVLTELVETATNRTIQAYVDDIHKCAVEHGWWIENRNVGETLALIHSEVSEALEAWRDGDMETRLENGKPMGYWSELADVVIRVMGLFGEAGVSLEDELRLKNNYNWTRPYRHGGKKA